MQNLGPELELQPPASSARSEQGKPRSIRAFRAERVPLPRSAMLFPEQAWKAGMPVDLEIGCGAGLHPIRYAQAHPDRFLVAIEHTPTRFGAFLSRLRGHAPFSNLLAVHDDAVAWVTHRVPAASLDRVFFLYPNPNPKHVDRGRRWHGMPFFARVIDALKPGGEVVIATNELFYFEEAALALETNWGLELIERGSFRLGEREPRTHFERKYLERGEACFEVRARKSDSR